MGAVVSFLEKCGGQVEVTANGEGSKDVAAVVELLFGEYAEGSKSEFLAMES